MGLLDKLWDDTLAGPTPDSGLGRLRKPLRPDSAKEDLVVEETKVTRSIMIKRPNGCPAGESGMPPLSPAAGTPLASPAGSTPPISPFSGGRDWHKYRRKSSSDAYERGTGPRNTTSTYEV